MCRLYCCDSIMATRLRTQYSYYNWTGTITQLIRAYTQGMQKTPLLCVRVDGGMQDNAGLVGNSRRK